MKSFTIRVLSSAEADLDKAFEYYSDISPKLGQRFIKLVNVALIDLKKNRFRIRYSQLLSKS